MSSTQRAETYKNIKSILSEIIKPTMNEHEKVKNLQSDLDSVKAELNELKQLIKQHISMEV